MCPFGVCLRLADQALEQGELDHTVAFSSWDYHPPYLPQSLSIAVGTNSDQLTEPMLCQIPFGQRPDQYPPEKSQPLAHPVGLREITRVEFISPVASPPSPELQAVLDTGQVRFRRGEAYGVELGSDGEGQRRQVDFRPGLPLTFCW